MKNIEKAQSGDQLKNDLEAIGANDVNFTRESYPSLPDGEKLESLRSKFDILKNRACELDKKWGEIAENGGEKITPRVTYSHSGKESIGYTRLEIRVDGESTYTFRLGQAVYPGAKREASIKVFNTDTYQWESRVLSNFEQCEKMLNKIEGALDKEELAINGFKGNDVDDIIDNLK